MAAATCVRNRMRRFAILSLIFLIAERSSRSRGVRPRCERRKTQRRHRTAFWSCGTTYYNKSTRDSGSHKVQHFFNAISLKIKAKLLTIDGPPENSSDLERAAAARSIADEFSGGPSIVNALQRCENTRFHIHTAPFGIRSRLWLYVSVNIVATSPQVVCMMRRDAPDTCVVVDFIGYGPRR